MGYRSFSVGLFRTYDVLPVFVLIYPQRDASHSNRMPTEADICQSHLPFESCVHWVYSIEVGDVLAKTNFFNLFFHLIIIFYQSLAKLSRIIFSLLGTVTHRQNFHI